MKRFTVVLGAALLVLPALAQQGKPTKNEIALAPAWKMPDKQDPAARELGELLSKVCKPKMVQELDPAKELFRGMHVLAPIMKAHQVFGTPAGMRRSVKNAAFPRFSFYTHEVKSGSDYFDRVVLLGDNANRLVGVQLVDDNPKDEYDYISDDEKQPWSTYDLLQGDTKGNKTWLVRAYIQRVDEVSTDRITEYQFERMVGANSKGWLIQIDTELLRPKIYNSAYSSSYRSTYDYQVQRRFRLFLPEPVAQLILYRANYQLR